MGAFGAVLKNVLGTLGSHIEVPGFESQLSSHFIFLIVLLYHLPLGKQQMMIQVIGSLSPTLDTQFEFLAFVGRALAVAAWGSGNVGGVNQQLKNLSLSSPPHPPPSN